MHSTLIALGLSSIVILSMGFLALAIVINRQMNKEAEPPSPPDDE